MIDGMLLVNKPSGPTSYDIIRIVKRVAPKIKIGHCGTLDPLASGLLILLFGKSTKKQSLLMGQDKIYRTRIKFGIKTNTGDVSGRVVIEKPVPDFSEVTLGETLSQFVGDRSQTPPMFSAIKMNGVPLYKKARRGEEVERKPRSIKIHEMKLVKILSPDQIEIMVRCSSGTYVRSLVEEIGEAMGTVATLSGLIREQIGRFNLNKAIPGENLFQFNSLQLQSCLLSLF